MCLFLQGSSRCLDCYRKLWNGLSRKISCRWRLLRCWTGSRPGSKLFLIALVWRMLSTLQDKVRLKDLHGMQTWCCRLLSICLPGTRGISPVSQSPHQFWWLLFRPKLWFRHIHKYLSSFHRQISNLLSLSTLRLAVLCPFRSQILQVRTDFRLCLVLHAGRTHRSHRTHPHSSK